MSLFVIPYKEKTGFVVYYHKKVDKFVGFSFNLMFVSNDRYDTPIHNGI